MVWFATPEPALDRTLGDFAAQTPIHATMVVLCDYIRDSKSPSPLCAAGARVASLNPVPESRDRIFVGEGHRDTLRAVRRLLAEDRRRLIVLKPETKPLFFAGVQCAAPLLLPWIAAGVESLRASGFTRADAAAVGEHLGIRAARRYAKARAKAWSPKNAPPRAPALAHALEAI